MDVKKTVDDITAWFKDPKIVRGISMYIVVIILMAINFSYWAGAIDVSTIGAPSPVANGDVIDEEGDYVLVKHIVLDQTGSGGPPQSTTSVNFNLEEGGKILILNLSCPNPRPLLTDYDLFLMGPDGNNIGSSTEPGPDEQIEIDLTSTNRTLDEGTYEAVIESWAGCIGTSWHLEVTVWYMEMCDDDGCTI